MLDTPASEDREFVVWLGRILRVGVIAAATIVLIGGALYLWRRGGSPTDYRVFRGEPADLRSIRGILAEAVTGSADGLIQLGLLVLIATPIARVLCSVAGFARERDWVYVVITVVVTGLLGYSLFAA